MMVLCVAVCVCAKESEPVYVLVRFICFALYTLFRPLKNPKHNSNLLYTHCPSIAWLTLLGVCVRVFII